MIWLVYQQQVSGGIYGLEDRFSDGIYRQPGSKQIRVGWQEQVSGGIYAALRQQEVGRRSGGADGFLAI